MFVNCWCWASKNGKKKTVRSCIKNGDLTIVDNQREVVAEWRRSSTYIVVVVAALRLKVQIPKNYEELSRKLLSSFPKGFQRVVTLANTYRWQAGERESCGRSDEKKRKNRNLGAIVCSPCWSITVRTEFVSCVCLALGVSNIQGSHWQS